jgi:uracil-DNA glycosylase
LHAEVRALTPRLILPVGKLAITQLLPVDKLTDVIGKSWRVAIAGVEADAIPLPHPSGASTWHQTDPGKRLLRAALRRIARHDAWRDAVAAEPRR